MACKPDEISILKAASAKLDDDNMLILAMMFHTVSKDEKKLGKKSYYTFEGRVVNIDSLKQEIYEMKSDAKRLDKWRWPTKNQLWPDNYYICYDGNNTNARGAKWLQDRISKCLTWNAFMDLAKNGLKQTARGPKSSPSAKYDLDGYSTSAGLQFSIDKPETLLALGQTTFTKKIMLKRDLP